MKYTPLVIDNFLDNYNEIVEYSSLLEYYDCSHHDGIFLGLRSMSQTSNLPVLVDKLNSIIDGKLESIFFHKHKQMNFKPKPHTDSINIEWAGVIHLIGEAGCGTVVNNELYDFKKNRLILYNSDIPHHPEGFTADRLVITFFVKKGREGSV